MKLFRILSPSTAGRSTWAASSRCPSSPPASSSGSRRAPTRRARSRATTRPPARGTPTRRSRRRAASSAGPSATSCPPSVPHFAGHAAAGGRPCCRPRRHAGLRAVGQPVRHPPVGHAPQPVRRTRRRSRRRPDATGRSSASTRPGAWELRIDVRQDGAAVRSRGPDDGPGGAGRPREGRAGDPPLPGQPPARRRGVRALRPRRARPASSARGTRSSSAATAAGRCYTLVREWGFDQFYRLVDRHDGALEPARVTGRSFEDFDDGRLQAEATEAAGADRCRTRLYLEGVHCAACVWLVEKLPAALPRRRRGPPEPGSAVAEITWSPGQTRLSTIARALDRLGYTPHLHRAAAVQEARRVEDRAALVRLGVAAACAMNLMFLHGALYAGDYSGMASPYETFFRWLSFGVAVPVLAVLGAPVLPDGAGRAAGPGSSTSTCRSRSPWP